MPLLNFAGIAHSQSLHELGGEEEEEEEKAEAHVPIAAQGRFRSALAGELEALQAKVLAIFDEATALPAKAEPEAPPKQPAASEETPLFPDEDPGRASVRTEGSLVSEDCNSDTGDMPSQQLFEELPSMFVQGADSSATQVTSARTPTKLMMLREEWVLDREVTRHTFEKYESQSQEDLSQLFVQEEARVIKQLRNTEWKKSQTRFSLRHSVAMQTLFESEAGGDGESNLKLCRCDLPFNPHSTGRLLWDLLGMLLLMYDIVTIPLVQFVLDELTGTGLLLHLIVNCFWTLDIAVTFLTATQSGKDGELETSLAMIALQYARSWLLLDLLMVVPEWISLLFDTNRSGSALFRILKTFRAVRLLRMIKMEGVLQKQLQRLNSENLLHSIFLLQLIFGFLVLNHFTACGWYFIGDITGDGWFKYYDVANSKSVGEAYLLAMHWSITQFHGSADVLPGNTWERFFAVSILIVGMLTFSVVLSLVTNVIFQMQQARRKQNDQQAGLRSYFTRHTVSTQLMLSVKAHLQLHNNMGRDCDADKELLQALPEQLGRSLLFEVRQNTIGGHWLFIWMMNTHCTAFRDVCYSAFNPLPALAGHSIFECANACTQMFFVESGSLRYISIKGSKKNEQQHILRASVGPNSRFTKRLTKSNVGHEVVKGRWVCEPALWVQAWQTSGELIALSNTMLLCLEGRRFSEVISCYRALQFDVTIYAQWVLRKLKQCKVQNQLDLWSPAI